MFIEEENMEEIEVVEDVIKVVEVVFKIEDKGEKDFEESKIDEFDDDDNDEVDDEELEDDDEEFEEEEEEEEEIDYYVLFNKEFIFEFKKILKDKFIQFIKNVVEEIRLEFNLKF